MTMNEKMDRRKKYTRMVLKESLIELLRKKPMSLITVKEICELADINRSTFYSHYTDVFDLLHSIEDEIVADMIAYLNKYNVTKEEESLYITEKLLEYVALNQEVCKTLISENGDIQFQKRVMKVAQHFLVENWVEVSALDEELYEYLSTFVISGCIHVIREWLERGMDKSPKEMAKMINTFANKGLASLRSS